MKKYIITLVFALGLGLNLSAQNDGFFTSSYEFNKNRESSNNGDWDLFEMPSMIGHGYDIDGDANNAPLGSGLLLLGGLALAYGMRKKK